MYKNLNSGLVFAIIFTLILSSMNNSLSGLFAQTGVNCDEQLQKAEEKYETGVLDEVLSIVRNCLENEDISEVNEQYGLRLMILIQLAYDSENEAKKYARILLNKYPNYQTDVDYQPEFQDLIEQTKREMEKQQEPGWLEENWYYVAGGSVVAIIIAIVASNGGGDEIVDEYPNPPLRP